MLPSGRLASSMQQSTTETFLSKRLLIGIANFNAKLKRRIVVFRGHAIFTVSSMRITHVPKRSGLLIRLGKLMRQDQGFLMMDQCFAIMPQPLESCSDVIESISFAPAITNIAVDT